MQATSIQLCVMLTVLEMVVRELVGQKFAGVADEFLAQLETLHANLRSPEFLASLAKLVALEESVYRGGHKNNYFADHFGADVLTDTTERSPTYCTPPFRKFDDTTATESWAFLFLPEPDAASAWRNILKREPRCVQWSELEICELVGEEKFQRTSEIINKISATELMRFRIGLDGVKNRPLAKGDSAIAVASETEVANFQISQLEAAQQAGARTGIIYFGGEKSTLRNPQFEMVHVPLSQTTFPLEGVARVAVKLVMNALSTCTMVRLGRVMGNYMVWVVPSNLKLIDRATRYVSKLTGLPYERANGLLFEIIEYVEPRMKADQAYPPVVGMAVVRAKNDFTNEQAERFLQAQ
jgi:N-acetylmuramic acid 6-phosphate etherase